jgi:hypothetical protein
LLCGSDCPSIYPHEYDAERAIVARIRQMHADDGEKPQDCKALNAEGAHTRYGCEFKTQTIQNIFERG